MKSQLTSWPVMLMLVPSLAFPANPFSLFIDPEIFSRKRMSSFAMSLFVCAMMNPDMFASSDQFKMCRIYASGISAAMMGIDFARKFTMEKFINPAMGLPVQSISAWNVEPAISIKIGTTGPHPTGISFDNSLLNFFGQIT